MRLVKLVKLVHTFILQNQRLKKTLYRIDFNGNLYRIILDGLAQKVMNFDVFQSSDLDFVACKNLPCQTLCLWKVLDFVESRILAGRAEFDLVIGPFGTWPWGPLQNRGAQQGPPNYKEDLIFSNHDPPVGQLDRANDSYVIRKLRNFSAKIREIL